MIIGGGGVLSLVRYSFSSLALSLGFNAPFIYIPDRAEKELGLTRTQGAMLLSVVGVSNTVGKEVALPFTLLNALS